jgi:hypothetical protein
LDEDTKRWISKAADAASGQRSVAELGGADVKQIDKKEECTVEVKGIDFVVYDVADMSRAIEIKL